MIDGAGKMILENTTLKEGFALVTNGSQRMKYIEPVDSKIRYRKKSVPAHDSFRGFRQLNGDFAPRLQPS